MIGMIILIGLFSAGLILMLWADYIEHQEAIEKFNRSRERTQTRIYELLNIENKYKLITNKWWFKLLFIEKHLFGESKQGIRRFLKR